MVTPCCMGTVGIQTLTQLCQGPAPGQNPGTPLGTEQDSNRARRELINSCMALKFGVVFFLESSARGQWELWCHLGFPRTSSPQSQHVPRDTLCPAGEGRRHLPGTMLSSLGADPASMVFWWNCCGVRHHMRLTAVRDASSHANTVSCQIISAVPKPAWHTGMSHSLLLTDTPNAHGLAPEQLPRFLAAGQSPQATSSSAQTQGLDYPITSHSPHRHQHHKHPLCSWSPHIPRDAQAQSPHLLHPAGLGKAGEHETPQIN